ncbi:MAG TPA: pirin family protein [Burkholderiales bacterium]|nr:pirin family protein [Burkholderiales bacterium]
MISAVIQPRTRDLGDGFEVRRALPAVEKRAVGPFVFFDQMGPVRLAPGKGMDVRPHPHIGLATITYLFEGEILHRDSLGTVQPIRPGEVNWMTAGRGIVHSERTPPELRAAGAEAFGIQVWVGLPAAQEEVEPSFVHFKAEDLPSDGGLRLIVGTLKGARSPVPTHSPMFYAEAALRPPGGVTLAPEHEERAAYVAQGLVEVGATRYPAGQLLVFEPNKTAILKAVHDSRLLLLGGAPLDGHRHMWWNFVSSRKERIAQAAADWKAGRFAPVPGETDFIPLPDNAPQVVDYP